VEEGFRKKSKTGPIEKDEGARPRRGSVGFFDYPAEGGRRGEGVIDRK